MTKNLKLSVFYILLFLLNLFIHLSLYKYAFDDAYIHFRISGNLLDYGKPYFNIDERLMASSSSGWTLMLWALFSIAGKSIKAVAILNAAITTLVVFVFARVTEEVSDSVKIANDILAALLCVPVLIYSSVGLMETPAALLILGVGILQYLKERSSAFFFLSACVFFRPELAVFLAFLLIHNAVAGKIPATRTLLYAAVAAAPFIYYEMWFFGTVIPHAIIAKPLIYSVRPVDIISLLFNSVLKGLYLGIGLFIMLFVLNFVLIVSAVKSLPGSVERKASLLSVPATIILGAYSIKMVYVFDWYIPLFLLPMLLGMFIYSTKKNAVLFAVVALAVFLPYVKSFSNTALAAVNDATRYPEFYQGARTRKYMEVASRLNDAYPKCSLMSSEVGGLSYGFKGKIFDGAGLLSDSALKYHPMKVPEERLSGLDGAIPAGYVKEVKPDIIVSYDCFCGAFIKSSEAANYINIKEPIFTSSDLAITNVRNLWDSDSINIFIKKEIYSRKF